MNKKIQLKLANVYDIKVIIVAFCVAITLVCMFFTIYALGKNETLINENKFLNKKVVEQKMMIDYLKGENK